MSRNENPTLSRRDNPERFSCTTSRYLLPTFRRPNYLSILSKNFQRKDDASTVCKDWSQEEGQKYNTINSALLSDDYSILQQHDQYIYDLKQAIREKYTGEQLQVFRGLKIDQATVLKEYKAGVKFQWPTFSCTSRNKDVASGFAGSGGYIFVIDAPGQGLTYYADISQLVLPIYQAEQEVLFYPYSGFIVTDVVPDARIVKLSCIDTLTIEQQSDAELPQEVSLYDNNRNMFVYFSKGNPNLTWSRGTNPNERFLIAQNMTAYWDAPYRFIHRNGYFVNTMGSDWQEWQNYNLVANFVKT
jgi:hypothetical protein